MTELVGFRDLIKNSFLKPGLFGTVNLTDVFIVLIITFFISLFIFYIYRLTYSGVMYNHNFNVSLVLMALITSTVIMTISSNLILSLGMVGALSIVRFRTAVKDPMDTVFMFWALALGITAGAKLYLVAVTGSLFIGATTIAMMRYRNSNNIFMLIIHYEKNAQDALFKRLSKLPYTVKSKTMGSGVIELTAELKLKTSDTTFVEQIYDIEGVQDVSLVSYNGNFSG